MYCVHRVQYKWNAHTTTRIMGLISVTKLPDTQSSLNNISFTLQKYNFTVTKYSKILD